AQPPPAGCCGAPPAGAAPAAASPPGLAPPFLPPPPRPNSSASSVRKSGRFASQFAIGPLPVTRDHSCGSSSRKPCDMGPPAGLHCSRHAFVDANPSARLGCASLLPAVDVRQPRATSIEPKLVRLGHGGLQHERAACELSRGAARVLDIEADRPFDRLERR